MSSSEPAAQASENTISTSEAPAPAPAQEQQPLSKNAQKRLRKAQEWEAAADDRRAKRKEKRKASKIRQREERSALLASGVDRSVVYPSKRPSTLVPLSIIVDCDFEQYMTDKERISLSSQVTRCYSDNRNARYRSWLWMAGWNGKLVERFETVLNNSHKNWKGVGFCEGDFVAASLLAKEKMKSKEDGGEVCPSLQRSADEEVKWERDDKDPIPLPDPEPEPAEELKDIVYLTSDSPYTLHRLEPHKSYIVGGLVDKNREKGLCYKRARAKGIRTARLPIGEFMAMQTRQVLTTNHVVEIMLKWMECEDWGKAFEAVIPKRKGGVLKRKPGESEEAEDDRDSEDEERDDGGVSKEHAPEHAEPMAEVPDVASVPGAQA
ncbi:tRNA (Guanine(9)-N1)-methyltransferase [Emericellopsis cladophorae]|uniref:tRNA (guanine(9)-N1)-methyltransferase n=1 Tax=Emericellopsis cladophorae TaxID=2686198 RepID=A0A9P9XZ03_9HYPO|nr:tRNA (Guanine(9)-N1)-methyltransferase [Emericellopsis cladophorae]KAI6779939.1 tRNA (Guanine(9)-N1)-methyltransferase [Emericellopsis cladophorae]